MAFKIEESFDVQAPMAPVWEYLIDPQRVASCLPGAELTEVQDERTFGGRVKVKVGPVTAAYKGVARLQEVDEKQRLMRLVGEGKETTGSGSAKMTMTGRLSEGEGGATRVSVEAEIDVAGKMAQFGRGLMEDVSRQLFRQFATCMQETLAQPPGAGGAVPVAEAVPSAPERSDPLPAAGPPAAAAPAAPRAPAPSATAPPPAPRATAGATPVRVLPLLLRALWSRIRRLLGLGAGA